MVAATQLRRGGDGWLMWLAITYATCGGNARLFVYAVGSDSSRAATESSDWWEATGRGIQSCETGVKEKHRDTENSSLVVLFQSDDDLPSGVTFIQIPHRLGDFAQPVTPVDDRRDLSGPQEIARNGQVLWLPPRDKHAELLAHDP
jgi:hypothetical protein